MSWAKVHTDILGDPKLLRAARKGAKHLYLLPWLIVFAKKSDDNGRLNIGIIPAEPVDIAGLIPCATARDVAGCIKEAIDLDILVRDSDGVLRFAQWSERQAKPSSSKENVRERVRRHRQQTAEPVTPTTVLQEQTCNAPDVTPRNATEERRGEERRREEKFSGLTAAEQKIQVRQDPNVPAAAPLGASAGESAETLAASLGLTEAQLETRRREVSRTLRQLKVGET